MISVSPRLHDRESNEAEQLRGRIDELELLLEVARTEMDQAEQALSTLRELVRLASHEMRSPLAALRLQIERLARRAREATESSTSQLRGQCLGSMRRLNDMLETLTEYCQAHQLRHEPRRQTFDLAELVRTAVADADSATHTKGLHFATETEDPLPPLRSDPVLLRLVLLHLLLRAAAQNAPCTVLVKITGHDSHRVTIATEKSHAQRARSEPLDLSLVHAEEEAWPPATKLAFIVVREMMTALGGRVEAQGAPGGFGAVTLTIPSLPACPRA